MPRSFTHQQLIMYLWQRRATSQWWIENEQLLRDCAGAKLALISQPNRKRLQIEVASASWQEVRALARESGGRIVKLPDDWLERFARQHKTKPLKIGNKRLIMPAGAAFGTGEHATTAMCLRMLDRVFCCWEAHGPSRAACGTSPQSSATTSESRGRDRPRARRARFPEFAVDLGTGSGVLALAARLLGAKRVVGIDNDPVAISIAKQNAQLNKIDNVDFRVVDVRSWELPGNIDIVTANLFSELLIEILPRLRYAAWLIISGILRSHERELTRALKRQKMDIIDVLRHGKWLAILGRGLRR
jgi:ribosomal protein L11 methyltransferase